MASIPQFASWTGFSPERPVSSWRRQRSPRAFMIVLRKRHIRLAAGQIDRAAHWAPSNGARPDIGKATQTNGGGVTRNAGGGEAMNTLQLSASVGCLIFGLMLSALEAHIKAPRPGLQLAYLCGISASVGFDV